MSMEYSHGFNKSLCFNLTLLSLSQHPDFLTHAADPENVASAAGSWAGDLA